VQSFPNWSGTVELFDRFSSMYLCMQSNAAFFSHHELVFTSRDIVITSCLHWLFTMSWVRSNQTSSTVVYVADTRRHDKTFFLNMPRFPRINLLSHCPHFNRLCYAKKFTKMLFIQIRCTFFHQGGLQLPPFSAQLVNSRCRNFLEITTRVYVYVRNPRCKHVEKNAA